MSGLVLDVAATSMPTTRESGVSSSSPMSPISPTAVLEVVVVPVAHPYLDGDERIRERGALLGRGQDNLLVDERAQGLEVVGLHPLRFDPAEHQPVRRREVRPRVLPVHRIPARVGADDTDVAVGHDRAVRVGQVEGVSELVGERLELGASAALVQRAPVAPGAGHDDASGIDGHVAGAAGCGEPAVGPGDVRGRADDGLDDADDHVGTGERRNTGGRHHRPAERRDGLPVVVAVAHEVAGPRIGQVDDVVSTLATMSMPLTPSK